MYSVFVEELEFYGHHGVSPEEQTVGHRFAVNASVVIAAGLPESDDVADTVDYSLLAQRIVEVGTGRRFKTVEALTASMCNAILDSFPRVEEVCLVVSKLLPPFDHVATAAGVSATVTRARVK